MSDYISREEAEKRIDEALSRVFVVPVGKSILSKLPATDVKPVVRGKWVWDGDTLDWEKRYFCNRCEWKTYKRSDYCPNCGADMREEQK